MISRFSRSAVYRKKALYKRKKLTVKKKATKVETHKTKSVGGEKNGENRTVPINRKV